MIAAPGIVAWNEVEADTAHVSANALQLGGYMIGHSLVIDIDMHMFGLSQSLDEEVIGRIDGFYLARPRVGVLGIGEPGGLMTGPFGRHVVALFFWSH